MRIANEIAPKHHQGYPAFEGREGAPYLHQIDYGIECLGAGFTN